MKRLQMEKVIAYINAVNDTGLMHSAPMKYGDQWRARLAEAMDACDDAPLKPSAPFSTFKVPYTEFAQSIAPEYSFERRLGPNGMWPISILQGKTCIAQSDAEPYAAQICGALNRHVPLTNEVAVLTEELGETRMKLCAANSDVRSLQKAVDALAAERDAAQAEIFRARQVATNAKAGLDNANVALEQARAKIKAVEGEVVTLQATNALTSRILDSQVKHLERAATVQQRVEDLQEFMQSKRGGMGPDYNGLVNRIGNLLGAGGT